MVAKRPEPSARSAKADWVPGRKRNGISPAAAHQLGDAALADGEQLGAVVLELHRGAGEDLVPRRRIAGAQGLEGQVEAALGLGQPAPAAVVHLGVPLVPDAAGGVAVLGAAHQHEALALVAAVGEQGQRRRRRQQIGDLAERLDAAIGAHHRGAAGLAHPHEAVVVAELDVGAAGRAGDDHGRPPRATVVTVTRVAPSASASSVGQSTAARSRQQYRLKVATPLSG